MSSRKTNILVVSKTKRLFNSLIKEVNINELGPICSMEYFCVKNSDCFESLPYSDVYILACNSLGVDSFLMAMGHIKEQNPNSNVFIVDKCKCMQRKEKNGKDLLLSHLIDGIISEKEYEVIFDHICSRNSCKDKATAIETKLKKLATREVA